MRFDQVANSSSFADVWMTIMLSCEGWSIKAVDPPMDWDDHPSHTEKPINTSFPVLFVSNTYDPVTPLAAGLKMAKKFTGAGLLEQQSEGHCSLAAPSICTILKLREYFKGAKVTPPPTDDEWEKCKADSWPWHSFDSTAYLMSGGDVGIQKAVEAVAQVQNVFSSMNFFGQSSSILNNLNLGSLQQ
jgi:hypothetical protein